METEKLLELAKSILAENPDCMLSGSLALNLQGIKTRREPNDIDIYLPYNKGFNKPVGATPNNHTGDDYPEENYERNSYDVKGVKVDVFTPEHEGVSELTEGDISTKCVCFADIIKFKVMHSLGDHHTKYKHRDDIIHILINN